MTPVLADVVWPALYIIARSYTWWGISLGLVIEYVTLRAIANVSWRKAVLAVLAVNAVTALAGYFAIPLLTFAWEYVLEYTIYQFLHLGTFNPIGWCSTILVMGAITGFPEYLLLRFAFRTEFKRRWPSLWWWFANCLSVLVAFISVVIWPVNLG
jgi:hypothetical protein